MTVTTLLRGLQLDVDVERWIEAAAVEARGASCLSARCGSAIVSRRGRIIGRGSNGPAGDGKSRTCLQRDWRTADKPLYDRTCCIHAEWRAINDAMRHHSSALRGSTLYFMRVDSNGAWTRAGDPYCTVCSRLILEAGISNVVLWQDHGPRSFSAEDYNRLSYCYYAANAHG